MKKDSVRKKPVTPGYPDVWAVVARIPRGKVATYGQIAKILGIPGRARFVGYALHALPPATPVPWQRVVNAQGRIALPGSRGREQTARLERDGVPVAGSGIDMGRHQWKLAGTNRRLREISRTRGRRAGRGRA